MPTAERDIAEEVVEDEKYQRHTVNGCGPPSKHRGALALRHAGGAEVVVRQRAHDGDEGRHRDDDDVGRAQRQEGHRSAFRLVVREQVLEVHVVDLPLETGLLRAAACLPRHAVEDRHRVIADVAVQPLAEAVGEDGRGDAEDDDGEQADEHHHRPAAGRVVGPWVLAGEVDQLAPQRPHHGAVILPYVVIGVLALQDVEQVREHHPSEHAQQQGRSDN
mmetsp:Transcript_108988/g.314791  ORF Transcript_108988/g.314791 Transcript_108988/m.314791 type:complete len:219 (+) Transcript_108988:1852-2508(+)